MNHLIVKITSREQANPIYKKLISERSPFSLPENLGNSVPYNTETLLEDCQFYKIENFTDRVYCIELLKNSFNSTAYELDNGVDVDKYSYLCSYQDENIYFFQKISKGQLLAKKFISFDGEVSYKENSKVIFINNNADAIYIKDIDSLYFKKLASISTIFKGIDQLYRESTQEETQAFLQKDFITLGNDFSSDKVKKANRHRIALVVDTLNTYNENEKRTIFNYVNEYCPELNFLDNKFTISSEQDLKFLLYGIEQRFFTTPVSQERILANSIIKMQNL